MAIKAKQILKNFYAFARVGNFSATGASTNVSTAIATVLATLGDGGVSVPTQDSSANGVGIVVSGGDNRVEIDLFSTKAKIIDAGGNEVYGRLTSSAGVYTLTYFSLVAGTETAYTFASATAIDFEFSYCFDLARLPTNALTGLTVRNVQGDPAGSGGRQVYTEALTVTAANTISNISRSPNPTVNTVLIINDAEYTTLGNAYFSLSGAAITWNPGAVGGFNLDTTDKVVVTYTA